MINSKIEEIEISLPSEICLYRITLLFYSAVVMNRCLAAST